jgi:hypothetical protein
MEEIKQNEIYIAPYDAKNIYLRSYQNTGKKSDVKDGALISLFNEYYGGGMNTIVFQELRETRGLAYNAGYVFPFLVVDEGVYHDAGTVVVAVETSVEVQLLVGDDRRQEVVVEFSTAQLRHLLEHEAAYLFQLLTLVRITGKDEGRIVVQTVDEGSGRSQLHLLLQVNLHQQREDTGLLRGRSLPAEQRFHSLSLRILCQQLYEQR